MESAPQHSSIPFNEVIIRQYEMNQRSHPNLKGSMATIDSFAHSAQNSSDRSCIPIDPAICEHEGSLTNGSEMINTMAATDTIAHSRARQLNVPTPSSEQPSRNRASFIMDQKPSLQSSHVSIDEENSRRTVPMAATNTTNILSKTRAKPKPRAAFLLDLPAHDYIMPVGPPLNFTIVEIICILPNWFKNSHIAARFQSNGITTTAHFAMLRHHRDLGLSEHDENKTKNGLTDRYRRAMRRIDPTWRKTQHQTPMYWNPYDISVNQFWPDAAQDSGYRPPESTPFKELLVGVNKLPEGADAGDLTKALQFALRNKKPNAYGNHSEFMFPTDIHDILKHVGYTAVTVDHTDARAINRYQESIKQIYFTDRKLHTVAETINELPAKREQTEARQTFSNEPSAQGMVNVSHIRQQTYCDRAELSTPMASQQQQSSPNKMPYSSIPMAFFREHDSKRAMIPPKMDLMQPTTYCSEPFRSRKTTEHPHMGRDNVFGTNNSRGLGTADPCFDDLPPIPDVCRLPPDVEAQYAVARLSQGAHKAGESSLSIEDMDALLAPYQSIDYSAYSSSSS